MSSPPSVPPTIKIPKQFKSLDEIQDFLKTIESDIKNGECSFMDLDFIPIFKSFQDLINQQNLDRSTHDLEQTHSTFKHKIEEIQTYITRIVSEDIFISFINQNGANEELIYKIMMNIWKDPLILEDLSIEFFSNSLQRLSKPRIYIRETLPEPEKVEEKGELSLKYFERPFEKSVNEFLSYLKKHMPCNLIELLKNASGKEEFYNWFIYSLHLIQKHEIIFDKKTGFISEYRE